MTTPYNCGASGRKPKDWRAVPCAIRLISREQGDPLNFLDRALPLIERGFSVIPIEPRGKRPIGGFGATRRTKDVAVVEGWAAQFPEANVGIVADENTVILESDDALRLYDTLTVGAGKHDWPETLRACGSSEDRPHFFFKRTERATNVGNLAVPGLFEARFSNQYVVGPGSTHPSGAVYRWLNDAPIVEIPGWLVSELARLAGSQKTRLDRTVETIGDKVPEGSRHYFLMREAGKMWDGAVGEDRLFEALMLINQRHCAPPREAEHVMQCVRDIMRREPYDPGPKVLVGGTVPNPPQPEEVEEWQSLSAEELTQREIPPRKAILTEGEAVLFYGQSINQILAWRGVGKTNFALGLAGALAAGSGILGFTANEPRRVLYLDGELPLSQLQERVRSFVPQGHRGNVQLFSPEMLASPRGLNLITKKDFDSLMRLVDRQQTEVIFLDSQATLMNGDSNKSEFQEERMEVLRALRWAGLCVIEMHHVGKTGLQRGISKNDDILDVQMYLRKPKEWEPEDGLEFEVAYEKIRHSAHLDSNYKVRLVDGVWSKLAADEVALVGEMVTKGKQMREIAKELKTSKSRVHRLYKKALAANLCTASIKLESE